jgi:hypothetical protein
MTSKVTGNEFFGKHVSGPFHLHSMVSRDFRGEGICQNYPRSWVNHARDMAASIRDRILKVQSGTFEDAVLDKLEIPLAMTWPYS